MRDPHHASGVTLMYGALFGCGLAAVLRIPPTAQW